MSNENQNMGENLIIHLKAYASYSERGHGCKLTKDRKRYTMQGATGTHTISIASSPERLGAHWHGFIANNLRAAK